MDRDESDQPNSAPSRTASSGQISLLSLPDELLHSVVSHIHGPTYYQRRSLRATALVCKRLQAAARPFLWRRVKLEFFSLGSGDASEHCLVVAGPWIDKLIDKLYDFDYARHVRELNLSLENFDLFNPLTPGPSFATFRQWFRDHYEQLMRERLRQLEGMPEHMRDSSTYSIEDGFCHDLRGAQEMTSAWFDYFVKHDLNETEEAGCCCYPLRDLPLQNLTALRLIHFNNCFTSFNDFQQHCRTWPHGFRPNDLTVHIHVWVDDDLEALDAETSSLYRTWAREHEVRLKISRVPSRGLLLDTGPYKGGDSSDQEADLDDLEEDS